MSGGADDSGLRLDDKVKAADLLYSEMFRARDRRILVGAAGVAILLHIALLLIDFPEVKRATAAEQTGNSIPVKSYLPPPPRIERRAEAAPPGRLGKKVPVPDPTPDEAEPIREPEPEIEPGPLPQDINVLIGEPEPPPPFGGGSEASGEGGLRQAVRIEESAVEPVYPELARLARVEAIVTLQVLVRADGRVAHVEVLRATRPNMGFEAAASAAVRQWRYEPALRDGEPVDSAFTVTVEFKPD